MLPDFLLASLTYDLLEALGEPMVPVSAGGGWGQEFIGKPSAPSRMLVVGGRRITARSCCMEPKE